MENPPPNTASVVDEMPHKPVGIMESHAGNRVMIISILIIVAIVLTLVLEVVLVETKFTKNGLPDILDHACGEVCDEQQFVLAMEQDAQSLRTDRVRTSMISRLMVYVVAEIVALMLVALGGVLIFNRIENSTGTNDIESRYGSLKTSFPGLIMCGLGTVVIALSLYHASGGGLLLTVYDRPVFTQDPNFIRNQSTGLQSGQAPTTTLGTADEETTKVPD